MSSHLGTFVANGGRFDRIITTEIFPGQMQAVLDQMHVAHPIDVASTSREKTSASRRESMLPCVRETEP